MTGLVDCAGLWASLVLQFCRSVNTWCLLGVSDSSNVPLCLCFGSEGRKKVGPPLEWEFVMPGRSGFTLSSDLRVDVSSLRRKSWKKKT